MTTTLLLLGAALGAPARYLVDRAVQARHDSLFPWGTWVVNVVGSFLLGLVVAGADAGVVGVGMTAALGTGFCGALTTYSTFGYETVRLLECGSWRHALANLALGLTAGIAAAAAGVAVGSAVW